MESGGFLRCGVTVYGDSPHVHQVVAGFAILAGRDEAEVTFDVRPPAEAPFSPHIVTALVGDVTVAYDMLDGYNLPRTDLEDAIASADLYFKRSFDHRVNESLRHGDRVRPFGLNYQVRCRAGVFRRMAATEPVRRRLGRLGKTVLGRSDDLLVETFERPPVPSAHGRVIFMSRAYDPSGEPGEDPAAMAEPGLSEEREMLNETRAACVRALRAELGDRFVGGLVPSEFARARYGDCVVDAAATARPRFLRALAGCDVAVATTGLHGSNQWKLAEYLAASKAVVTQPLRYEVPAFNTPEHYLPFETPEECVEQTTALIDDPERRVAMMRANRDYYEAYVRPDAIVRRSLRVAAEPEVEPDVRTAIRLDRDRERTSR